MPNTFLNPDMITYEALRLLTNNTVFCGLINRQYDDRFAKTGAKIGDSLRIRKPAKYTGQTAVAITTAEDITEQFTTLTIDKYFMVPLVFDAAELTLEIDDFSKRILAPAVARIANYIDEQCLALYKDVYNIVGTPGTTPSDMLTYLNAKRFLNEEATPSDKMWQAVISPGMEVGLVNALSNRFNPTGDIAKQNRKGVMGTLAGFDFSMDQNVQVHTVGTQGGSPLVDGGSQADATLSTKGWTALVTDVLKQGDVITIDGVFAVNPMSFQSTGQLRRFVVTADVDSDAGGLAVIPISPAITPTTAFKNVTGSPADNAVITVIGNSAVVSPQGLCFHPDAFTLAMVDLPKPEGVDESSRKADKKTGLSIRYVRQWDNREGEYTNRLDVLFGVKTLRPEMACRVAG